jgi:hypothetical protein
MIANLTRCPVRAIYAELSGLVEAENADLVNSRSDLRCAELHGFRLAIHPGPGTG